MKLLSTVLLIFLAVSLCASPSILKREIDEFTAECTKVLGSEPPRVDERYAVWHRAYGRVDVLSREVALVEALWREARRSEKHGAAALVEKYRAQSIEYLEGIISALPKINTDFARLGATSDHYRHLRQRVREESESYLGMLKRKEFPKEAPNQ